MYLIFYFIQKCSMRFQIPTRTLSTATLQRNVRQHNIVSMAFRWQCEPCLGSKKLKDFTEDGPGPFGSDREQKMFLMSNQRPLEILGIKHSYREASIKKVHEQFRLKSKACDTKTREGQRELLRLQRAHELITNPRSNFYSTDSLPRDRVRQKLFLELMPPFNRAVLKSFNVFCMFGTLVGTWILLYGMLRPAFKLREKRQQL